MKKLAAQELRKVFVDPSAERARRKHHGRLVKPCRQQRLRCQLGPFTDALKLGFHNHCAELLRLSLLPWPLSQQLGSSRISRP